MKYAKKMLIFFIIYLIAGALLVAAAMLWAPNDNRINIVTGIVSGFLITGIGGIFLSAHLLKNPKKAEATAMAKNEERAQFLRQKTQAAVHTITIMLISFTTIAAEIMGYMEIALTLAVLLIIQAILYIFLSIYYTKKY